VALSLAPNPPEVLKVLSAWSSGKIWKQGCCFVFLSGWVEIAITACALHPLWLISSVVASVVELIVVIKTANE